MIAVDCVDAEFACVALLSARLEAVNEEILRAASTVVARATRII